MNADKSAALKVQLEAPTSAFVGEPVFATVRVSNISQQPVWASSRLNLYESDLRIFVAPPVGARQAVQATAMMDSFARKVELAPGAEITGHIGLLYTNVGFTFDREGVYRLQAEYDPGGVVELLLSNTVDLEVRPAASEDERALASLMKDETLARCIAVGDAGDDRQAMDKLKAIAERFPEQTAGAVARIVLGNTMAQDFRDLQTGDVVRKGDRAAGQKLLEQALQQSGAMQVAQLTAALLPPASSQQPTRQALQGLLDRPAAAWGDDEAVDGAKRVLQQSQQDDEM